MHAPSRCLILTFLAALLALAAYSSLASAASTTYWHSPSKNIACNYYSADGIATVDCQTQNNLRVVILGHDGRATSGPGTIRLGAPGNVLPYGRSIRKGGFTCRSQRNGMRCYSGITGHGFRIWASGWERFRVRPD